MPKIQTKKIAIYLGLVALTLSLATTAYSYWSSYQRRQRWGKELEATLARLREKAKPDRQACERFSSEARGLRLDEVNTDVPLTTRAELYARLRWLANFPGSLPAGKLAMDEIQRHDSEVPLEYDQLPKLTCELSLYFSAAKHVLLSIERLRLKGDELGRSVDVLLGTIQRDLRGPVSLLQLSIYHFIVEELGRRKLVGMSDPIYVSILDLREEIRASQRKFHEEVFSPPMWGQRPFLARLLEEREITERVARKLASLLERAE